MMPVRFYPARLRPNPLILCTKEKAKTKILQTQTGATFRLWVVCSNSTMMLCFWKFYLFGCIKIKCSSTKHFPCNRRQRFAENKSEGGFGILNENVTAKLNKMSFLLLNGWMYKRRRQLVPTVPALSNVWIWFVFILTHIHRSRCGCRLLC